MARDLGPKRNNGTGLTKIIEFEIWNNRTFWGWNAKDFCAGVIEY